MERPAIFNDVGKKKKNKVVESFHILLGLERKQAPVFETNELCSELHEEEYFRCREFDDLCRLIFFNIIKGKKIDNGFKTATFCFLRSIHPLYLVDFFSILEKSTFRKMRIIFSDDNMLDILKRMRDENLFIEIEDADVRHEIEKFLADSIPRWFI